VRAWLAAVAVLAIALAFAPQAAASPKGAQAKAAFDRGVVAYQKGEFAAAADALGTSFKLEPDVETLFAWAQAERQLENCEKSIELFNKLLGFDLPTENKKVVQGKIDECKAIIAAKQPKDPVPTPAPVKPVEDPPQVVKPLPDDPPTTPGRSPWWKDPIGDGLVGLGVVGLGVGGYFLISARQAEQESRKNIDKFQENDDLAQSRGKIGVISTIAGGVLVVGGIVRYATRGGGGGQERRTVTGWLTPDGGGIAAFGRF
jgi:tetratricopeptide (TPR) repeat protein